MYECSDGRNPVEGEWKWGEHALPRVSNYTYLGIDWDLGHAYPKGT